MRSPVSRVASAIIFLLAMGGVALWFHGGGAQPALANFLEPILEAKTLRYKVTVQVTSLSPKMKTLPAAMQQELIKGTTSEVMILDAARKRTETVTADKSTMIKIWDRNKGKKLCLLPEKKRATVYDVARTPEGEAASKDPSAGFRTLLLRARDMPGVKHESLGKRKIDGRQVVGVRLRLPAVVMSVWGDPKTGLPVYIESTAAVTPNMKVTMSDFELNVDLDESLFSVEPPPGYEVGSFFITTPVIDPSTTEEKDLIETFREYTRLSGGDFPAELDMESIGGIVTTEFSGGRLQKPGAQEEMAEIQAKLQPGLTFSVALPEEADAHYAGKGVSLGAPDTPIFWYRPKDAETYRVIYADLSIQDADTPPAMPVRLPEQDLIDTLRYCTEVSGGPFPDSLKLASLLQGYVMKKVVPEVLRGERQNPSAEQMQEIHDIGMLKLMPGFVFTNSLPPDADMHYAGRGVSLGAADTPVFWYRPKDSKKYRVIYADLSVLDADAAPDVAIAPPEQDLIDAFRHYSELSGGPFPDSLDTYAIDPILRKKFPLEKGQKLSAKQLQEVMEITQKSMPYVLFARTLPPDADAHYAGKGVSLGAADTPIFWHRPKDAKTYRVIDADLSIREAETPPTVPDAQPLPAPSSPKE